MFINYIGIVLIFISVAASVLGNKENNDKKITLKSNYSISKSCHMGDVVENECNKCTCTPTEEVDVFVCDPRPCIETQHDNQEPSCHPHTIYVRNTTVCLCTENGSWPHEHCKMTFKTFLNETKHTCEPDSYVIIDCNVCKCGHDGNLDKKSCTKNKCITKSNQKSRRFIKKSQVYGSCEAKNWYSLAPCQFCFCISENKLVCNTGNNIAKKLELGSYNLSICGKDLIRDAINLIPDKDKALRLGNHLDNKTISATKPKTTKTEEKSQESVELNREYNEKVFEQPHDKTLNDSEEYYSDTDEVKASMPNDREILKRSPYGEEDRSESDNEISVAIDPPKPAQNTDEPLAGLKRISKKFQLNDSKIKDHKKTKKLTSNRPMSLGDVLKPYLPSVFKEVLRIGSRKSMISVDPHSTCSPGATTTLKCNTCFCLKNNKLLCTNKECQ